MSLHTTIEPPSLVPLWLTRSQRPSASNASPVGVFRDCRRSRHERTKSLDRRARPQQLGREGEEIGGL